MKRLSLICLVFFGSLLALGAAERLEISRNWQFQIARNSSTPPIEAEWSSKHQNYKHARRPPNSASAKARLDEVHSIWLRTEFTLPDGRNDSRFAIDFTRINGNAIVFLNGRKVGERLGPYGEIDVTGFTRPGRNELVIFNTRDYTDVSRRFKDDLLRYHARGPVALYGELPMKVWALGIDAPLFLVRRPNPAAIADAWAETSFRRKSIDVKVELDASRPVRGLTLECAIFGQDGAPALQIVRRKLNAEPGVQTVSLQEPWSNPRLWEVDGPWLYRAELKLADADGKVLDTQKFNFGFREVWTEGRNLMLNGHPLRFRVEWSQFGFNEHSMSLFKLLGRNMIYYQNNPSGWWRGWAEVFFYDPAELELMDRNGVAVLLAIPTCNYGRKQFLENPEFFRQYCDEMSRFLKRYRNHPSILAWCISMNSFNPTDGIHPDTLGQRRKYDHIQAKVIEKVIDAVHQADPTRLAYAHAEGNLGDLASGNTYPNFTPPQEAEDWPEYWSKHGDMPWWACEFAAVYDGTYFRGKQFLLTEFAAIYFGPDAYRRETARQLAETVRLGVDNRGHGGEMGSVATYAPLYWDVQRLYVERIDRAWRTYGVLGWHYFNFGLGYGNPPEFKGSRPFDRYRCMTRPVTGRPDWANPQFDYHAKNMQPLLIYLGGNPHHTDKTHSWFAGETIRKNIAAVWDGSAPLSLRADWQLLDADGKSVADGTLPIVLKSGDIRFFPIEIPAPTVARRSDYTLKLTVKGYGDTPITDTFSLQVFPAAKPVAVESQRTFRLWDPAGKSGWVKQLLPGVREFRPGDKLAASDVLIIGRETLQIGMALPFTSAQIADGLQVLILEHRPELFEALGLRNIDPAPRTVFPLGGDERLLEGLAAVDFAYWRGSPDLLPEFKHARSYDVTQAPKTSNRNAVASTVIEIPQSVGFRPLFACEFDMNYTPLLEFAVGKGRILYSTFDFTGRVGSDPAATRLAGNLLRSFAERRDVAATRRISAGGPAAAAELTAMGITPAAGQPDPARTVLVFAATDPVDPAQLKAFTEAGGEALLLDLAPATLASLGVRSAPKTLQRAPFPEGEAGQVLTPNMFRWRDVLKVNAITGADGETTLYSDGILAIRRSGKGRMIFVQVAPAMLAARYREDNGKQEGVQLSVIRMRQMAGRLLGACGAAPMAATVDRLMKTQTGASFQNLDFWYVYGAFNAGTQDPAKALNRVYPGEEQALSGDMNPNLTYPTGDGRILDFRKTAVAENNGFINVGRTLEASGSDAVGYAIKTVKSETRRRAMLRLGADYFFQVYLNGKLVYEQARNHAAPKPNVFRLKLDLRKGDNVIVIKLMTGSKGFGFWANLSEPGVDFSNAAEQAVRETIYDPSIKLRTPYEFNYW